MTSIYLNDKTDLYQSGSKYLRTLSDILSDIQVLSQRLTVVNKSKNILVNMTH